MVGPLNYFLFQPVLHDWCNKGCGMCYPVCGMVHIKDPLPLIEKSSSCSGGSGFPLSLSEWSFTICPMLYNRIINVLSALLNKTFPSFYSDQYSSACSKIKCDVFACGCPGINWNLIKTIDQIIWTHFM